jgi:hypothetical protein
VLDSCYHITLYYRNRKDMSMEMTFKKGQRINGYTITQVISGN